MLVYRGLKKTAPSPTVLTIGNFDGLHLGHRALLTRVVNVAASTTGWLPSVLTFEPHPRELFSPQLAPVRLSLLREKLKEMKVCGIQFVQVVRFNAGFAAIFAEAFIEKVLVDKLNVKHVIVGHDFRFGKGVCGDFQMLSLAGNAFGFTVESMDAVLQNGTRISSSLIRTALADGRMDKAGQLLGNPYKISGRVIHGHGRGREVGFATANICIKHVTPPLSGVFAVTVNGPWAAFRPGIANLGFRPSFGKNTVPLLEVHLFDCADDLYGEHLNVWFLHKLRDEIRFPDITSLTIQIARDVQAAKNYFMC